MAFTHSKLADITVGAGGAAVIEFSNIPQNYNDLIVKISGRDNRDSQLLDDIRIQVNNIATASYSTLRIAGFGSSGVAAGAALNVAEAAVGFVTGSTATASTFGNTEIYLPNYTSNFAKTGSIDGVSENNGTVSGVVFNALYINTTSPIVSIQLKPYSLFATAFLQHSTATLYGVKAEV
jgi:hypothetical protein